MDPLRLAKGVEAVAGPCRDRHDRRAFQKRSGDELANLEARQLQHVGIGQIGFGERNEAGGHAQEPADVEMLAGLRHHRLVGRDDEDDEIDAADPGEHVLDEPLVAGHVDEREVDAVDDLMGEPEVDGDAAGLLFLEPIRIGSSQRLDQRALAVIDVSRGTDDDVSYRLPPLRPCRSRRPGRCVRRFSTFGAL